MKSTKTYLEMIQLPTFRERYDYLKLDGGVGIATFGFNRYLNQALYTSKEWRRFRREIIERDNACDLGILDRPINVRLLIHHLNPITEEDIVNRAPCIFDPNNVICCSHNTHEAIHYGDSTLLIPDVLPERTKNDTIPWR